MQHSLGKSIHLRCFEELFLEAFLSISLVYFHGPMENKSFGIPSQLNASPAKKQKHAKLYQFQQVNLDLI